MLGTVTTIMHSSRIWFNAKAGDLKFFCQNPHIFFVWPCARKRNFAISFDDISVFLIEMNGISFLHGIQPNVLFVPFSRDVFNKQKHLFANAFAGMLL